MPLWVWILILAALIKLPIAGLMLWIPFREDEAMRSRDTVDSSESEDDGGSKALPGGPVDPRPRRPHPRPPLPRTPRRGPHGSPALPAPRRVRSAVSTGRRVRVSP